ARPPRAPPAPPPPPPPPHPRPPTAAPLGADPLHPAPLQHPWHGPGARADEAATFAADVFSDILNQPTSRFQRRLVESGLWQGVLVNYYTLANVGPITVSGQTAPEKLREALAVLDSALAETVTPGYFTADELEAVKANRAVTTAFGAERGSENAHTIGFWWSVLSLDYHFRYIDEMARQTPAQLQAYARKYILGKPRVTGVMLPTGARTAIGLTTAELER
ncbi:MAG: M16 family metallopeptidase, partial [Gemmatimonadota bacterium]